MRDERTPRICLEPERLEHLGRTRRDIILERRLARSVRASGIPGRQAMVLGIALGAAILLALRATPEPERMPLTESAMRVSLEKRPATELPELDALPPERPPTVRPAVPGGEVLAAALASMAPPTLPSPESEMPSERLLDSTLGLGARPVPGKATEDRSTPIPRIDAGLAGTALAMELSPRADQDARIEPRADGQHFADTQGRAGSNSPPKPELEFFGEPIHLGEGGLVFVLDRSGSMALASAPFRDARGRLRSGSKLDCVRAEVEKALERLPSDRSFNLVLFGEAVYPWRPEPVEAEPPAKASALDYLSGVRPSGPTRTGPALVKALAGARSGRADCRVLLLSDGHPTADGSLLSSQDEMERHLRMVREANDGGSGRRVGIDVFGLGVDGPGRDFLVRLAAENAGKYVEIGSRTY